MQWGTGDIPSNEHLSFIIVLFIPLFYKKKKKKLSFTDIIIVEFYFKSYKHCVLLPLNCTPKQSVSKFFLDGESWASGLFFLSVDSGCWCFHLSCRIPQSKLMYLCVILPTAHISSVLNIWEFFHQWLCPAFEERAASGWSVDIFSNWERFRWEE